MPTSSGISGKGGSVRVASAAAAIAEIPMKSWTITSTDNIVEVTNFTTRNAADDTVAVASYVSGIRKFDIECSGYPDTNLDPNVVIGSTASFYCGIAGGETPTSFYPAIVARITDLSFNLDVNGALECSITATSLTSVGLTS
jgi:hypothetical protein